MDVDTIVGLLKELLYFIVVFGVFFGYAIIRGRQALINLILGLYLALLISLEFPYYDYILNGAEGNQFSTSGVMIAVFAVFTVISTFLFGRLMPGDYDETAFEGFGKKLIFALLGSVLIMAYSYHVLPVTDLITPGSPIQTLFGPESRFFWWLLIPLAGLFFL